MKKTLVSAIVLSTALFACSSDPIVTDNDIRAAKNGHTLDALYQRLQDDKKIAKSSSEWGQSIRTNLDKVGKEIALQKEQNILASLQKAKITYDNTVLFEQHDIATLTKALERTAEIEKYNKEVYFGLARDLEKGINAKRVKVQVNEAEFRRLADREAVKKVALLDQNIALEGGDKAAEIALQKTAYIDGLFAQAETALSNKRHEDVLLLVSNLEKIDPDYAGLEQLKNSLYADEYEQQFWDALGAGDTDKAYELFYKLSQIPGYMDNNHSIKPIAEDIAQYFLASGKSAMSAFNMPETYKSYSRTRYIYTVLGKSDKYDEGELSFIKHLETRIAHFVKTKAVLQAYGYLSVLEEMQPSHELLAEMGPSLNNEVLSAAVIKILPLPFSDKNPDVKLAEFLNKALSDEVKSKLPTRLELLDVTQREQYLAEKVKALPNVAGFYAFSGELLHVGLNEESTEEVETQNVLVSRQRVENPEYLEWLSLPSRKKRKTDQPQETLMKDVNKDVQITHAIVNKKAEASITYRINEIVSTNVTMSDALNETYMAEAKSTAAVDEGLFKLDAVEAVAPANEEMLTALSLQIAEKMVAKIATSIDVMEDNYMDKAQAAFVDNNYQRAATNFAYRNVLYKTQGKQNKDALSGLRVSVMHWN